MIILQPSSKLAYKFKIEHDNKIYATHYGAEAYIFHTGVYNDIKTEDLVEYTNFVFDTYLYDTNRTNLGELSDYIARKWPDIKNKTKAEILDDFYFEEA